MSATEDTATMRVLYLAGWSFTELGHLYGVSRQAATKRVRPWLGPGAGDQHWTSRELRRPRESAIPPAQRSCAFCFEPLAASVPAHRRTHGGPCAAGWARHRRRISSTEREQHRQSNARAILRHSLDPARVRWAVRVLAGTASRRA